VRERRFDVVAGDVAAWVDLAPVDFGTPLLNLWSRVTALSGQ
jgi:hypothetical protein